MVDYWGKPALSIPGTYQDFLLVEDDMGRVIKLGSILEPDAPGIIIQENLLNTVAPTLHSEVTGNIGDDPRFLYTYLMKETRQTVQHFTEWVAAGDYQMTQRTFHGFNLLVLHGHLYTMAGKYMCNELQTCVTIHIHRLLVIQRHTIQPSHDIEFLDYLAQHHSEGRDHLRQIMVKKIAFDIKRYAEMPQFEAFCRKFPKVAFEIMKELLPSTIDPIAPLVINHEGVFILGDSPLKRMIDRCIVEKAEKEARERAEREALMQAAQGIN
ncbi:hypothetical protein DFP73DRAFT_635461 [Morchella snyderi]|nr:hypothetical protein DFP73DRAFT_635461 [Morchella snyderi]